MLERTAFGLTSARTSFHPRPADQTHPPTVGGGLPGPPGLSAASAARWRRARALLDQRSRETSPELSREPADGNAARALPLAPGLAGLPPWAGLRRGSTVVVHGSTSLLLAVLAGAMSGGCWAAVVGLPDFSPLAAADLGIAVHRLALVPRPGADLASVLGALLDGVEVVAVTTKAFAAAGQRGLTLARRLSARARNRGVVLLPFGHWAWPGADVELRCPRPSWSGIGDNHGYLAGRRLVVTASGRGAGARPVRVVLDLSENPTTRPPAPTTGKPTSIHRAAG